MSNRAERRRAKLDSTGTRMYSGQGISQEAIHKYHNQTFPALVPGQHLWTVVAAWRTADPEAARIDLDTENLLSIEGPCCYWCEQPYIIAKGRPCPGDASA